MTDEELEKAERGVKNRWSYSVHCQKLCQRGGGDTDRALYQCGVALGYVEAVIDLIAANHGTIFAEAIVRDWIDDVEEREDERLIWQ